MRYIIDVIPGYGCNFRCKYCFEKNGGKNYINISMSDDIVCRTISYIKHFVEKKKSEDPDFHLTLVFYGGEPLLYLKQIKTIISNFSDETYINFHIVTNGFLIFDKIYDLLEIKNKIGKERLWIAISYDYYLQNKNRHDNTYMKIRNNIVLLLRNDFYVSTISVFPNEDLKYFYNVVIDFLKLKKKFPQLYFKFNIDRLNVSNSIFNYDETKKSLDNIKTYLNNIGLNLYDLIHYNDYDGYRKFRLDDCIYANIYCVIDVDGNLYPACNSVYSPKHIRDMLCLGNINTDFDELYNKHKDIISKLNLDIPEKCKTCENICRVMPWRTIKTDISEINGMPSEEHCVLHELLTKYLKRI